MRARLMITSVATLILAAFAPAPFLAPKKPHAAALEGLWEQVADIRSTGERPTPSKSILRIEKDKWSFLRGATVSIAYRTTRDDKAPIPTLDLHREKPPGAAASFVGIYKIEGDFLYYSYSPSSMGRTRPTGFKPTMPSHMTMKFRRVKEAKK